MTQQHDPGARTWWHKAQPFTLAEQIADTVIHSVALLVAVIAGGALVVLASQGMLPVPAPALAIYLATFLMVFSISLAFNLWPITPIKQHLARLDQAAIFLFIAGSYTPFLALLGGRWDAMLMMTMVWGASLVGVALKLIVPHRFGRLAVLLYLAIGASGVLVFQSLAAALPGSTMWLLVAGGVAYSAGIIFHLWEKLHFQNVVWHAFVLAGASLHLWAIYDCLVLNPVA